MSLDVYDINKLARDLFVESPPYIDTTNYDHLDLWQADTPYWSYYTSGSFRWIENLKGTEVFEMYVYNIFLVNTKECEVVQQYKNIVAESEKMAAVEISMDPTAKKALRDGELKLIFNQIGGFDKYKK